MPDIPTTLAAQLCDVVLFVECPCGCADSHEIICQQDDAGSWSVSDEDRFILCDECGTLLDAGLQISMRLTA